MRSGSSAWGKSVAFGSVITGTSRGIFMRIIYGVSPFIQAWPHRHRGRLQACQSGCLGPCYYYTMRSRIGVIGLVIICVGLVVALIITWKQGAERQHQDAESISTLSNNWFKTSADLGEQRQVSAMLEKDLDVQKKELAELTNQFSSVPANLAQTSSNLAQTEVSLQTSQEEVKRRDNRIAELENQNQALDKQ